MHLPFLTFQEKWNSNGLLCLFREHRKQSCGSMINRAKWDTFSVVIGRIRLCLRNDCYVKIYVFACVCQIRLIRSSRSVTHYTTDICKLLNYFTVHTF